MKDEMHKQVLNKWQKGEMKITKNIKQIAKELISKIMQMTPNQDLRSKLNSTTYDLYQNSPPLLKEALQELKRIYESHLP